MVGIKDIGNLYTSKDQQFISAVYYNIYNEPKKLIDKKRWIGEFIINTDLDPDVEYVIELHKKQQMVCSIKLLKIE